jgi:hypothetical protein
MISSSFGGLFNPVDRRVASVASAQLGFFSAFFRLIRYRGCSNSCNGAGNGK